MDVSDTTCSSNTLMNDIWSYRFHNPNDENWTLSSYIHLQDISTVDEFWKVQHAIKEKLKNGMFFLMREHVFPCWDDKYNINGGCLSIKVLKENLVEYWQTLCMRTLGECLLKEDYKDKWSLVNGISTSPKRYFCIVKIWMGTNELNDKKYFNIPGNHYGDIIYKENKDNIQKNRDT